MTNGAATDADYERFFHGATGKAPYRWQSRLAQIGLPETLEVPTGCGKTAGVVLAWLHRRRFHFDPEVRSSTPRKLVFTLPMRTLVSQTREVAAQCLDALGLTDEVELVALMGGEDASDAWRLHPERDAIAVCTLDMGLSGALNRAYGSSRFTWPITFGMLNNDTHWVFDEVQLFGPATATSRQLQAFRNQFGTNLTTRSTWMSATLDLESLCTVDAPTVAEPFRVDRAVESSDLLDRLDAPRRFERWVPERPEKIDKGTLARTRAERVLAAHRPATRTLVVVNTVEAARLLHTAITKATSVEVVLLHSRFRPGDRAAAIAKATAPPGPNGAIVVSTQVIEAGVDVSSATLFTEVAPWSSIVQRAGRCNRYAEVPAGSADEDIPRVYFDAPLADAPYEEAVLSAAHDALVAVQGTVLTTDELATVDAERVETSEPLVLRRTDMLRLFDTAPDLAGNDLDIGPYLRDGDDLDAYLSWRTLDDDRQPLPAHAPTRDELCPIPVKELKEWLKTHRKVVRLDHLDATERVDGAPKHRWIRAEVDQVRPGAVFIADPGEGGYHEDGGWDPKSAEHVAPVTTPDKQSLTPIDEAIGSDPGSIKRRRWVSLSQHLGDVREEATLLVDHVVPALPGPLARSVVAAARWHDLGKSHNVFQTTMSRTVGADEAGPGPGPWAKSAGSKRARHERPHFRHELASALALLDTAGRVLPTDADHDLTIYLVAAHHGRVRMSIRSYSDEADEPDQVRSALGIRDGDPLPGGLYDGVDVPDATAHLRIMDLGNPGGSWVELATRLRDRADLGIFRLGHLEALVRVADWRVSAGYDAEVQS